MNKLSKRGQVYILNLMVLFLISLFFIPTHLFCQSNTKVTTAKEKIAVINAGSNNGFISGQKYLLKRMTPYGLRDVGIIRVEKATPQKSGIRLIEVRDFNTIQQDDFLGEKIDDSLEELFGSDLKQNIYQENTSLQQHQSAGSTQTFVQGKIDGARDAKGNALWLIAGVGCGVFGVGAAYFTKPSPPTQMLIGKSRDYVMGYTEGFQGKSRETNTGYACAGWGTWALVYLAISSSNN